MSNCKECLKSDVCKYNDGVNLWCKGDCPKFVDLNQNLELPCKVGDTVYCIDYILKITEKCKVYGFQVFADGKIQLLVDNGECKFVTSNWYNTQEEAEKRLKEQ